MGQAFAAAISPELPRTAADTLVAELLPLLAACEFLERQAAAILAPRKLGRRGLPFWLAGVSSEVHRVPLGHVLIIGPANYPLFLPGVQTLQALAAGNAVTWKPGVGGQPVARLFADAHEAAGLPQGLLQITGESVADSEQAVAAGPDKVFFTGSATTGRLLMHQLAETLTPSVMELSGCDAVIVLPSANVDRVVRALAFGIRLNGSQTCMAPRRVLLVGFSAARRAELLTALRAILTMVPPVAIADPVSTQLRRLLADARHRGALVEGYADTDHLSPILVTNARPEMPLTQADLLAPVLCLIDCADEHAVLAAQRACPYALTTSIFGDETAARPLAARIDSGTVMINDLIVPTADPRVPFGGRRQSGFGVTRGAEGLLEMTAVKVLSTRHGHSVRHYQATTPLHTELFDGIVQASHSATWGTRFKGLQQIATAGKRLAERG
jgi:aldehyde dehydrogenase (NAD+)